jgi:hypothetical protein
MGKKAQQTQKGKASFSKKEAAFRFEAALRGSRHVDPTAKPEPMKRGRRAKDDDPMPTYDAEALIEWGKRNIQKD